MIKNTTNPIKNLVNMAATTEFQKTKYCGTEFCLETESGNSILGQGYKP